MATWPTPRTWVAGETPTASTFNTYVRDAFTYLYDEITVLMTNKSGGSVAAGDVLVWYTSADAAFTTSANLGDLRVCGVAAETIANDATGRVYMVSGLIVNVNCSSAAVSRGQFLMQSGTVKEAISAGYFKGPGVFALAVANKSAGSAGLVKAQLIQGYSQAVTAGAGYALGGYFAAATNDSQKFNFAAGTWAGVAGANLPANRERHGGNGYGTISALSIGGNSGAAQTTAAYLCTFATDTTAAQASADLSTQTDSLGSGANGQYRGFTMGGQNGSTGLSTITRVDYSTYTRAAASYSLPTGTKSPTHVSDGTYIYTFRGDSASASIYRTTIATDETITNPGTAAVISDRWAGISFPVSGGYLVNNDGVSNRSYKVAYATGTVSTVTSTAPNTHRYAAGICDGLGVGYMCGDSSSGANSTSFTLSTETYAAAVSAALATGKNRAAYANNGAY